MYDLTHVQSADWPAVRAGPYAAALAAVAAVSDREERADLLVVLDDQARRLKHELPLRAARERRRAAELAEQCTIAGQPVGEVVDGLWTRGWPDDPTQCAAIRRSLLELAAPVTDLDSPATALDTAAALFTLADVAPGSILVSPAIWDTLQRMPTPWATQVLRVRGPDRACVAVAPVGPLSVLGGQRWAMAQRDAAFLQLVDGAAGPWVLEVVRQWPAPISVVLDPAVNVEEVEGVLGCVHLVRKGDSFALGPAGTVRVVSTVPAVGLVRPRFGSTSEVAVTFAAPVKPAAYSG